jgi:non-ribosomal peptide synthetase component F
VRALCLEHRVTLYAAMMAALQVLLARCCGQDDVTVGSSVADRGLPEFEELIGFCVNTVALRTDLSGDPPFADVARRVQAAALGAYEHVELPFERLVEELAPGRTLSQMPLFSVVMTYVSTPPVELVLPGVQVSEFAFDSGIVRYDLECFVFDSGGEITVEVDYQTDLFDAATIGRLLEAYLRLLADAVRAPGARVSSLGPPEPIGPRGGAPVRAVAPADRGVGPASGEGAAGTERGVAALFDEIFARQGSGPGDDFFELGGHSLLAIKLVNRVRQEFGVEPSLRGLFTSSTVARLAGEIDALLAAGGGPK